MVEVEPEEKRDRVKSDFLWALHDFRFVPGGRIMAAAGTNHGKTMINCFVLPLPKDSRRGILKTAGDMIEIMAKGGGVGLTISSLRPRSALECTVLMVEVMGAWPGESCIRWLRFS